MMYELKVGVENRWCRDDGCIRSFGGWYFSVLDPFTQACEHKKNWESKKYCICRQTISNEHYAEQSAICLGNKTPNSWDFMCPICVLKYLFLWCTNKERIPASFNAWKHKDKRLPYMASIWHPHQCQNQVGKDIHRECCQRESLQMPQGTQKTHVGHTQIPPYLDIWGIHFS